MTTPYEQARLTALHEYRLLDAPAGDELEAVVRVADSVAVTGEYTAEQADRLRDLAGVLLALFERRRQARVNGELVGELRRSNAELAQFAAVVSHDLAAPLSVVDGYLEVLDDRIGPDDAQSRKWIGAAGRAVGRMQRLITSLLSYAQAGNAPCRTEPARLGDLVEQALTDLRPVLGDAVVVVPAGLPELDCDPTLTRQLLQNLIGNAVKHRYPDRPCRIEISTARAGAEWRVTIADNGPGIPADQRDRVFEMFTQVDPSAGTGYGVGLSTCQRIVERHNGRITATESPGGGATITFSLPAVRHAATAAAA